MAGQVWSGGWSTGTLGGYFTNIKLSEQIRYAAQPLMRFRQFCNIHEALGKGKGDTIEFPKVSNLGTSGGTLVETNTMPETNFTQRRGTMTVNEYGLAVPYTGKLEALSAFSIKDMTTRTLRDDEAKVLDSAAGAKFTSGYAKYVCLSATSGTLTTNSTAGGTATGNLNVYHLKQIVKQLKKWNIKPFSDGNYICIGSIEAIGGLRDDTATGGWIDAAKYAQPRDANNGLFTGEVGKIQGVRCLEENNVLSNIIGNSSAYGEAVVFGDDAVVEAIAVPEEIRAKIPTDYGRSQGVAWYGLLGFELMWSFGNTGDAEEHIIHVTSL